MEHSPPSRKGVKPYHGLGNDILGLVTSGMNMIAGSHLRLSIKRLGDWTEDVSENELGKSARIWGPYGQFSRILLKQAHRPAVLIGGGIGITPFLSIVGAAAFYFEIR